jgi:hypothetical protein
MITDQSPLDVPPEKHPTDRIRLKPDNIKLFESLLQHAAKIALLQYAFSATLLYFWTTDKWSQTNDRNTEIFGFQLSISLWAIAFPFVAATVNIHITRIIHQMTRMMRKNKRSSAVMAILAIQSVWFGNPFHSAIKRDILSIVPLFYMMATAVVPSVVVLLAGVNWPQQSSTVASIVAMLGSFLFIASLYCVLGAVEICRDQIRKVLLRKPLPS